MLMENFLFGSDLEDSFQEEEATKPPKKSERDARMNEKEEEVESDGAWSIFEIFCVKILLENAMTRMCSHFLSTFIPFFFHLYSGLKNDN